MIFLKQIASTDTVKNLRKHLNSEAQVINETQPCIGMAVNPTVKFYEYPKKLLATCESEDIGNNMFLLCLPNRAGSVYVAQAWGELVLTRAPTLAEGVATLNDADFIRVDIPAVKAPTKETPYKSFSLDSVTHGSNKFFIKTDGLIEGNTYSLGRALLGITQTLAAGPDVQYAAADNYAYVEAGATSCSILIATNTVYTLL